jgi:hypothetical protein
LPQYQFASDRFFHQLTRSQAPSDPCCWRRVGHNIGRANHGGLLEKGSVLLVRLQERLDLAAHGIFAGARRIQKSPACGVIQLNRRLQHFLNLAIP